MVTVALPFDHVKSRMQVGAEGASTLGALGAVVRTHGPARLYVGYGSALLRGIPGAAVVFAVYGTVEARLRRAAGGGGRGGARAEPSSSVGDRSAKSQS